MAEDHLAWSVLFKPESMKDVCVREMSTPTNNQSTMPSTLIELCFKYEGLPESRDATELKTEQSEDEDFEGAEAEDGAEGSELEEAADDDELPKPDQFDLAKLFAGPNMFNTVSFLQCLNHSGLLPNTVSLLSFYLSMERG